MVDLLQVEFLLRVLLAALCGGAIGYERESRMKMAGIRTHLIVSLAAALMMIVSKYGFNDILPLHNIGLDPSRIAAGVVTAIGFLGAGVIFVRKQNISGITTAAGIWATVGVGIAVGAGMYFLGVASALLIILLQVLLHKNTKLVKEPVSGVITLLVSEKDDLEELIQRVTAIKHIEITSVQINRLENKSMDVKLYIKSPKLCETTGIVRLLKDIPNIQSVEL